MPAQAVHFAPPCTLISYKHGRHEEGYEGCGPSCTQGDEEGNEGQGHEGHEEVKDSSNLAVQSIRGQVKLSARSTSSELFHVSVRRAKKKEGSRMLTQEFPEFSVKSEMAQVFRLEYTIMLSTWLNNLVLVYSHCDNESSPLMIIEPFVQSVSDDYIFFLHYD